MAQAVGFLSLTTKNENPAPSGAKGGIRIPVPSHSWRALCFAGLLLGRSAFGSAFFLRASLRYARAYGARNGSFVPLTQHLPFSARCAPRRRTGLGSVAPGGAALWLSRLSRFPGETRSRAGEGFRCTRGDVAVLRLYFWFSCLRDSSPKLKVGERQLLESESQRRRTTGKSACATQSSIGMQRGKSF